MPIRWLFISLIIPQVLVAPVSAAETLSTIRERGRLIWGADSEGGGPYVYPDPDEPTRMTGFEVDLAAALAHELGVAPEFSQGPWDNLPALLKTGQIDIVLNGYELMPNRLSYMDRTSPYYVYEFALLARRDNAHLKDWSDLRQPVDGRKPRVGVLTSSGAFNYLRDKYGQDIDIVSYDGNTDAMREVETGKLDATIADLPVAIFYRDRFKELRQVGQPAGQGYYVIYLRKGDARLREALDGALARLVATGELRNIYERYGLWNPTQEKLNGLLGKSDADLGVQSTELRGWQVIASRGPLLLRAAGVTVVLACIAMPLAIALGLGIALVRLYGPKPLKWLMIVYVEILRGTPLLLQLFVIFFLLPEIGLGIPAFYAAIAGLAINYSAYESEIYRAGLQAIPKGQMEAALALGMTPLVALRRIIVPQAMRIVVPPVTNDFIALFKDTSVCSVITVVELTKEYSIQRNDTGATLELAAMTALLYLSMSVPLAHLTSRMERRMRTKRQGG